jgi:hypothetical protein
LSIAWLIQSVLQKRQLLGGSIIQAIEPAKNPKLMHVDYYLSGNRLCGWQRALLLALAVIGLVLVPLTT